MKRSIAIILSNCCGEQEKRQGRPPAVLAILHSWFGLLLVDGFLEFGPRAKLRDFAGSDLNGRAGLRIASVPRFSL
jgi:hypothetical protein